MKKPFNIRKAAELALKRAKFGHFHLEDARLNATKAQLHSKIMCCSSQASSSKLSSKHNAEL